MPMTIHRFRKWRNDYIAHLPFFVTIITLHAPSSRSPIMGRPKKSAPAHVEPEDESQEAPEEEPASTIEPEPGTIPQGAVSQTDAARAAMDAGYEKPAQAVEYIKTKFGLEMNPQYFSAIKSRLGKSEAKAEPAKRGRKPKAAQPVARKPVVDGYLAPPEKPKAADEPDILLALEGIKELVSQFGADRVKRMVDLLG
jgi:hypothetical protein